MPNLTEARQAQVTRFEKALGQWTKAREDGSDAEEVELAKRAVYACLDEPVVEPAVGPDEPPSPAPKVIITPPPEP